MAVGKLHILWPHLDSDLFTKITIFLVRFFVLTVGYYEASEGQPVLGLTVLGPLLDSAANCESSRAERTAARCDADAAASSRGTGGQ